MRVVSVNQDPGISPARHKGAVVHLAEMRRAMAALGAEVVPIDEPDPALLRRRLGEELATAPGALVYERYALGRSAAAEVTAELGVPLVVEVNAPLADEERRWRGRDSGESQRRSDRFLFATAAAVVAVSSPVAEYARGRGAPPNRVRVFANGVDPTRFAPSPPDDPLRRSLVPPGHFAIGFHGRLRPWHRFERLVAVCARLLARGVPVQLLAVGEGDFEATVDGRLPRERVTLVGWKPHAEVGRYVAAFDALPLVYGSDAPCYFSPLKLAEGMACGAVPVVPDLGDLAAAVGGGGLVYPPDDMAALETALFDLAADLALREALSREGVRRARELSWHRVAAFVLSHAPGAATARRSA